MMAQAVTQRSGPRPSRRAAWREAWTVLLALLVVAGCGRGDPAEAPDAVDGPVRLTYWSAPNPQERALAAELVADWNAAHPDIQVDLQALPAGQSSEEVLLAAIVAGTTPDICSNIWPGVVGDFVEAGGVLPLDGFPGFDSLAASRYGEDLLAPFRAEDSRVYQLPWKTNPIMMVYNAGLFRDAGILEAPRTYSAYLDAAGRLSTDRDGDGRPDRWIGYRDTRPIWWQRYFDYYAFYIGASGGETLFRDGTVRLEATASNGVFDFFRSLYANRYFPVTTFQGSPFLSELVATEFTGPWQIGWLEDNAPPGFDYAVAPLPLPDAYTGPAYTYGDYKNIVVFSTTEHPEAAWRFARYLVSRQADLRLLELTRQIPVRRGLLGDSLYADFFASNPKVAAFAEQAARTRGVDAVGSLPEMLDAIAQQFEAAAVYGVRSPAEATAEAEERIRLIHDWEN